MKFPSLVWTLAVGGIGFAAGYVTFAPRQNLPSMADRSQSPAAPTSNPGAGLATAGRAANGPGAGAGEVEASGRNSEINSPRKILERLKTLKVAANDPQSIRALINELGLLRAV